MKPSPHPIDAALAAQLDLVKRRREVAKGLPRRASLAQREAAFQADRACARLLDEAEQAWRQAGGVR